MTSSNPAKKEKIVIDNDAGGDDSMAIFLALLYEKYFNGPQVVGLTTCFGNTIEDNVCINNQRILKIANRQNVPIFRGSKRPLVAEPPSYDGYFGQDGLGDADDNPTDLIAAHKEFAATMLIELSKIYNGELTVVAIGPLTNIALAIRLDPSFLGRLNHLYIGGGHVHDENHPEPEYNARTDAEAYHVVAQKATPDKVTFVPFSQVLNSVNITKTWREKVLGSIETEIMRAQNKFEKIAIEKMDTWEALDPATVAVALRPYLVEEFKYAKNDIAFCGDQRGLNTNIFVDMVDANVRIVYSIKQDEYMQFLLDVFGADVNLLI